MLVRTSLRVAAYILFCLPATYVIEFQPARTMARVRLRVLLLIAANLPLLCAELSGTAKSSSNSGRDKAKPASCGKGTDHNCEALT